MAELTLTVNWTHFLALICGFFMGWISKVMHTRYVQHKETKFTFNHFIGVSVVVVWAFMNLLSSIKNFRVDPLVQYAMLAVIGAFLPKIISVVKDSIGGKK